ncbi:MAG: hypothetical protein C0483_20355 [Pirellula sp.]|nr:hypothetical protein [Pirellula sp.]
MEQSDRARQGQRGSNLGGLLSDGIMDGTKSKASAATRIVLPESDEMCEKREELGDFRHVRLREKMLPKGNT